MKKLEIEYVIKFNNGVGFLPEKAQEELKSLGYKEQVSESGHPILQLITFDKDALEQAKQIKEKYDLIQTVSFYGYIQ